jgi:peptidoglycan/LPS O-acetylase OafA/YrhL
MSLNTKNYRWDIQGLRAIAVLAVVIFHINPLLLPGGYVGVDIFFVISGYLIMGFIWRDLQINQFNLLKFYTKRVYRLFPTLFVMVIVSSIAAYYILLPNESELYFKSMLSTLFYFSNFYFYTEADYFNDAMAFYPLLHTWSLSVEEQFYMLFPLILIWIYKKQKKYIFTWLMIIGLFSLILSQWYVHKDASFSFFASPTRFFQFILGGLIAITLQTRKPSKHLGDLGVISGLILIFISIYYYSEKTLFPGINALLPSVGTGFVLYFGIHTYYSKFILENKAVDLIGNASYSIYLWHWPLIVFYKLKVSPNLSQNEQWALFGLSILFGIFSWKFIENRFRKNKIEGLSLKPIAKVLAVSTLVLVISGSVFKYYPYKTLRYQTKAYEYLDFNTSNFRDGKCFLTSNFNDVKFYNKTECVTYQKGKKNYLLIGDSHAAHYYSALHSLLKNDETLTQVTSSGCIPIIPFKGIKRCSELMNWAFNDLIPMRHFDTIILSGHWGYVNHKGINETAKYLKDYTDKIIVLGPSMQYSQPLPRLLVKLGKDENSGMIYKSAGKYKALTQIDNAMKSYFNLEKVHYISVLKVLCDNGECKTVTLNGTPINFDESHLTHEGAYYILKRIQEEIFQR